MIPRIFHFIWVGDPMPDRLRRYVGTWQDIHPDWDLWMWDESTLGWLTNIDLFHHADNYTNSPGQFRSDIARYEILHRYGGVYVDCDFEARKPIDALRDHPAFAAWEVDDVWVNNAILGSVPGHPVWQELIDALPANVDRTLGKRPNVMTGPQFITGHFDGRDDVAIYPAAMFYPYLHSELHRRDEDFPEALAVHRWQNAMKRRGLADA